jgi:hypothetical protein
MKTQGVYYEVETALIYTTIFTLISGFNLYVGTSTDASWKL